MENTVGSLPDDLKSILIGKILGDGSLRKKTNTLLEVNHSSKQKEYVMWLYSKFSEFVKTPPKLRVNGKNRHSYRFTTQSVKALNEFYDLFYSTKGYKSLPKSLILDSLALAIWFMDDGSRSRSAVYLNTQQFDLADQKYLISLLYNCFGLKTTLNKDKSYYRIRISSYSIPSFRELISPYLLDCMRYKLPL